VEVAFSVGFNAQTHFSTVFKRFTGQSPARWKQECQRAA
jgi:AraC family transcriptional regulator